MSDFRFASSELRNVQTNFCLQCTGLQTVSERHLMIGCCTKGSGVHCPKIKFIIFYFLLYKGVLYTFKEAVFEHLKIQENSRITFGLTL